MSEKRKLRHRLWTEVILISVLCVFALTGCGGNEKRAEETPPEPTTMETVAVSTTKPKPTKKPEKRTEKPKETFDPMSVTKGDIEANFDEALKHVTICGKKLSFPFTLDDLGEEFDVDMEYYNIQKGNDLVGDLLYQGKAVDTIWIKNGRMKGDIRKKPIIHIQYSKWASCQIGFELCGVSLGTSKEYVNEMWGEDKDDDGEYRKGGKKESKKYIMVSFANEKVADIEITVH